MANVFDGLNKQYLESVNTPDYTDDSRYAINPTLPGGVPYKYLKVTAGVVSEMDQAEKDAVDASMVADLKITKKATMRTWLENYVRSNYPPAERATFIMLTQLADADGLTNRRAHLIAWYRWFESSYNHLKGKIDAVDAASTYGDVSGIALDTVLIETNDPHVTIKNTLDITD